MLCAKGRARPQAPELFRKLKIKNPVLYGWRKMGWGGGVNLILALAASNARDQSSQSEDSELPKRSNFQPKIVTSVLVKMIKVFSICRLSGI